MKIRVLLIDDEKDYINSLSKQLTVRNYDVTAVYNGDEALNMIQKSSFDVIILDVSMPGKDGIETLRLIKKIDQLVQVIMLTGNVTVEKAIAGMKIGAYDFLMKPIRIDDLVNKIDEVYEVKIQHEKRIHQAEIDNIVKHRGW
jgi:DNA-binding NtrC family response regulator